MKTVLFVGAGRHQRRAILQARERGLRVVAIDRNADAPGLVLANVAEVVDFADVEAAVRVARTHAVDGVLTVSADRAVPVVAAVAEALALPGIGVEVAVRMTHKRAMREALAAAGVPQPGFACVRTGETPPSGLPFPVVAKPVDSGGQRGVVRVAAADGLDAALAEALAASTSGEAIVEAFVDGVELNGIVIVREGRPETLTLSDRLRPEGAGFGVGWIHRYPCSLTGEALARAGRVAEDAVRALGLRDGIAFPQLIASPDGEVVVVEVAARIPGGQMADLVRHATGVDLVEIALRQSLGEEVPDTVAHARFVQPLAIRFLTARPGPLPVGEVVSVGPLDPVLACEGVVQAETYLQVGETIRPVRLDGDRRGYVLAVGDTADEALARAEAAAARLEVTVA
ncbi:MAG: ATP-grasp domain-containing protein [Thermoleophilia bacterium]|nr:ATP-grasp domain-containing protein [Thermoleophilia bacterium]